MSDTWEASVNAGGISLTGRTPSLPLTNYATLAARIFVANEGTDAGPTFPFSSAWSFAILAWIGDNFYVDSFSVSHYEWRASYLFLQKPFPADPFNGWVQILQPDVIPSPSMWTPTLQNQIDGANGSSFFGGGTLSITKDYAMAHYQFTTPLGSLTVPFDWLANQPFGYPFWTPTDTPLVAAGFGHALAYADHSVTNSIQTDWNNFYTRQNGVIVAGAALTVTDPGHWDPAFTAEWTAIPGGGMYAPTGVLMPSSSSQQTSAYRSLFSIPPFPGPDYEATDEQRYAAPIPAGTASGLDLAPMLEHSVVFRGWAVPMARTDIRVSRSHDAGHSWTDYVAISDAHPKQSVSLSVFAGLVYAVYYDETATSAKQVVSRDLGNSWSSPVSISITGTNPRLVIAPDGPFFYFSLSGTSIVLQRSFDLGSTLADPTPIPVATTVDASDFAAIWTADRSLVVAYTSGSLWKTRKSVDLGTTWANA